MIILSLITILSVVDTIVSQGGINLPCPAWSAWTLSTVCAMPNALAASALNTCPVDTVITGADTPVTSRFANDVFSISSRRRTKRSSIGTFQIKKQKNDDKPKFSIDLDKLKDDEARDTKIQKEGGAVQSDSVLRHHRGPWGYPSYQPVRNSGNCVRLSGPFAYINQPCGLCSVQYQCRTRANAYGCYPNIEIERLQCPTPIDTNTCTLPQSLCASNLITQVSLASNPTLTSPRNTSQTESKSRCWSDSHCGFGEFCLQRTCQNEKSLRSYYYTFFGTPRRSRFKRQTLGSGNLVFTQPRLNCATDVSVGGCRCCCAPFRPNNLGQCIL